MQGHIGSTGRRGERGLKGDKGIQGSAGAKGDRVERGGERGVKREKGIHGDNSDVLSVLADHLPIQLATRYGEKCALSSTVQKATSHGHFLETKNSAYHCPYDLANNKVNAIYIVYKIRKYDSTGLEHNYRFFFGMGDNHRSICILNDERTMGVYGVAGMPTLPVTIIHAELSYFFA